MLFDEGLNLIGKLSGWISVILFSFTFYPQIYLIYKTKSCEGFSLDYAVINPFGYFYYIIYNLQGLINEKIGKTGRIDRTDLLFAVHAFVLSVIQLAQVYMYDKGNQRKVNSLIIGLIIA